MNKFLLCTYYRIYLSLKMNCDCGVSALQKTVSSNTPNKGRNYWSCGNGGEKQGGCKFFVWVGGVKRNFQSANRGNFNNGGRGGFTKKPRYNPLDTIGTDNSNSGPEFDTFVGQGEDEIPDDTPKVQTQPRPNQNQTKVEPKPNQTEEFALALLKERIIQLEKKTESLTGLLTQDLIVDIQSTFKNTDELVGGQEEIQKKLAELRECIVNKK